MRTITYLSPTSLTLFTQDKVAFYLRYLADAKCPRDPQTEAMAVGSSFDAYVKSYLFEKLFGKTDPRFELDTIFEAQVEPPQRDKARTNGNLVFQQYKASGALVDLMVELNSSITTPKFEFDLLGVVSQELHQVPLLGKPDLFYTNKQNARVIHDWKVNGFYSQASPAMGYILARPGMKAHKNAFPMMWKGIRINTAQTMDMVKPDWAQQLAIYMWLCGEPVGTQDCVASIDQLAYRNNQQTVAEHRSKINESFQQEIFRRARTAWECINSGHYFGEMPKEDSDKRCQMLDKYHKDVMERPVETTDDDWHSQVTRPY